VMTKSHHALVDGVAGLDVISALFAPEDPGAEAWRPRRPPSQLELVQELVVERLTRPAELVRLGRAFLSAPGRLVKRAAGSAVGLGAMALRGLPPAPSSPYNRNQVGPDRRVAWVRASLDDFKAIKDEQDVTVNDVVLAAVARALRRHLQRRGDEVEELHTFVPVSVRGDDRRGETGNEVAGLIVRLPIACEEPIHCLRQIADETRGAKDSGQALGARALTELSGFAPPTLLHQGARLTARQRFVNLVVTNIPGPQRALRLQDRELLEVIPLVPLGKNLTLNVAIVSYNGGMFFGLVGDFDAVPDLDDLAKDLTRAISELGAAAGVPVRPEPVKDLAPVG
jgi:diacylglycerol O-acyltransferase